MKTKKFLTLFLAMMTVCVVVAQTSKQGTIEIKTSAQCGMCKDRIETGMAFEKGIKDVSLDLDTKIVTVNYNPKKTSQEEIRKAISMLGYDADSIPANAKAYAKLPPCCKKDAPAHK